MKNVIIFAFSLALFAIPGKTDWHKQARSKIQFTPGQIENMGCLFKCADLYFLLVINILR